MAVARRLGFRRILTSGGALAAPDGAATLAGMMAAAGTECIIMPGSGISAETLPRLTHLPLREVHASCAAPLPAGGAALAFGFQSDTEKRTERARVAALKAALAQLLA